MTQKSIDTYTLGDISEVTLLSIEEWEKAREISSVPKYISWWWLRSPGDRFDRAATVDTDGDVYHSGDYVFDTTACIRPAFRIPSLKSKIGSKIFVQNTLCTVIDTDYVLSDMAICWHRFDKESNDYDKSEIKQFINSDKFINILNPLLCPKHKVKILTNYFEPIYSGQRHYFIHSLKEADQAFAVGDLLSIDEINWGFDKEPTGRHIDKIVTDINQLDLYRNIVSIADVRQSEV